MTTSTAVGKTGEYSKALRAIGSALDVLPLERFLLTYNPPNYILRLTLRRNENSTANDVATPIIEVVRRVLPRYCPQESATIAVDVIYTPSQIEELHQRAQQKNGRQHPRVLADALGAIGSYLEHKGAHLVQISRPGQSFTMQYTTAADGCVTEEFSAASWYDLIIMFLSRGVWFGRMAGRNWAREFASKHGFRITQSKTATTIESSDKETQRA
jgi:hypothetical protein